MIQYEDGFNSVNDDLYIKILTNNKIKIGIKRGSIKLIAESMAPVLGFIQNNYDEATQYIAEIESKLLMRVYLYIETLSNNEPIAEFCLEKLPKNIRKKISSPVYRLQHLLIKFKKRCTDDDDLFDFRKKPHSMKIKFNCF